jgi:nitrate/nitrite transporter NarK
MLQHLAQIHPLLALAVVVTTAGTDAVYVFFTAAVSGRRRISAATWSSAWYLLSSFAVITYTRDWTYVVFAALGSWIGAYFSMSLLHAPQRSTPAPVAPPLE